MLVPNWRDEVFWTEGGMRRWGGRGFQAPGRGKRAFFYGHGMAFFLFSWLSTWEVTRMKESKSEKSFSDAYSKGFIIATGRSIFG